MDEIKITECHGFDWDDGNSSKNGDRHNVLPSECEQIFFNKPLLLYEDTKHSGIEKRAFVLGKTDTKRKLFIAFTVRKQLIRVISARDMSKKERGFYDKAEEVT